jgi:Mimiviridae putative metallopeptidase WLM domain protein
MKIALFILTLIIVFLAIYFYFHYTYPDMTYVKSDVDDKYYLVRNVEDKHQACNMLAKIRNDILKLSEHLYENRNKEGYKHMKQYIEILHRKAPDIVFVESTADSQYTSYCVNKGEQIVFCLRTKEPGRFGDMHAYNLVTYVVLHEISHSCCPEWGHGALFKKIFAFLTKTAIKIQTYTKIDFDNEPEEYCGMTISDSII